MPYTKYQGSKPYGFRQEDFSMFFPLYANVKYVTPGAGPFLAPGHNPQGHATYMYQKSWL